MRRPATWLAVGVVLLVGVAAAADAVRQKASKPEAASTTTLRAAPATGLSGVLYYTDEECQLRAVRLPGLSPADAPQWNECTFSLSPDGARVGSAPAAWHPGSTGVASESEGSISVGLGGDQHYSFLGSAPSFNEGGLLTFALGSEIRAMGAGCPLSGSDASLVPARVIRRCSSIVVPREAVERAARRHPNTDVAPGFLSVTVRETVWLGSQEGPDRLAALLTLRVRTAGTFDLLALFERGGIVETVASFESLSGLHASPGGSYLGVLDASGRMLLLDREGRDLAQPRLINIRGFEWSPDERWVAIATPSYVYLLFSQPPPGVRLRRLSLDAADLAWRDVLVLSS